MHDLTTRLSLMIALNAIETRLAAEPDSVGVRFDRARCIQALGRADDALRAYGDVLARDPGHLRAMNALGLLLLDADQLAEAETVFGEAVARHPDDAESRVNLAYVRGQLGDRASAREHYEVAVRLDPTSALAQHGLAAVLEALGEESAARHHRDLGFAQRPITELRYRGRGTPTRVLLVGTATDGNLVTRRLLDDRVFLTYALVVEHYDPATPLPPHDLVVNAIGEADVCAPQLAAVQAILGVTSAPVVNHPSAVLTTGREAIARRLRDLPDVLTPTIVRFPRAVLAGASAGTALANQGLRPPFLLRAPGHHGGKHFERVDDLAALPAALAQLPGDELLAISFLDARGADGNIRKYRVMIVDGRLYPLHLAIGERWKLHYFSADMANSAAHRTEEAAFLADLPTTLGPRAMTALKRISAELGLDYAGIDFGVDRDGRVLVFEANATMVVPPADPEPAFAYRRPAAERIIAAVHTMLLARAER
ncbi:MAG: tetratricopeptide repeat protein [Vulcanimicrobiaceae bacterium]|jgi:hypothetical protein